MKKLILFFMFCAVVSAAETVRPGSKVYVTPTQDDFDRYLMSEIQTQGLPILLVRKHEEAEFEISVFSPSSKSGAMQPSIFSSEETKQGEALSVTNLKTGRVVFSVTIHNGKGRQDNKSAAEICVKHLRKIINKH